MLKKALPNLFKQGDVIPSTFDLLAPVSDQLKRAVLHQSNSGGVVLILCAAGLQRGSFFDLQAISKSGRKGDNGFIYADDFGAIHCNARSKLLIVL